jgi:hypothetical protein
MTISTRLRAFRTCFIAEPTFPRKRSWLDSTIDVDEDSAVDDHPCDGDDFEPSLGSFDRMSNQIKAWLGGVTCDVDVELDKCDDEESDEPEDGRDDEPSLGSTNDGLYIGPDPGTIDCEGDEHDGREPGEDDEPSLGSFDRMVDQRKSMRTAELRCTTLGGWPVMDGEIDRYA